MQARVLKANIFLLITAVVWGSGFVAQRSGMDYVGPMTYNAVRFAIGALSLLPLIWFMARRTQPRPPGDTGDRGFALRGAVIAGSILFCGVALQQIGLIHTTAGKAGFITGLYVVLVPFLGLLVGQRPGTGGFVGAICAGIGLYYISVTDDFSLAPGDAWVIVCAVFWAVHVLVLGWLSPRVDCVRLAFGQFAFCSLLHFVAAFTFETPTWAALQAGWFPIVYGGIMPVGVAYTLQVVAQKDAPPTHAAVILSLEAVFAALCGWLILDESMAPRTALGCTLMLAGMFAAQLWPQRKRRDA